MSYRHPSIRSVELPPSHSSRHQTRAGGKPLQGVPVRCPSGTQPVWLGDRWSCAPAPPTNFGQMQIPGPPDYLLNWEASAYDPATGRFDIPGPPDYLLSWQGSAQTPGGAPPPPYPQGLPPNVHELLRPFPGAVAPSIDPFEPPTLQAYPPEVVPPGILPPSPIAPPIPEDYPQPPPPSEYAPPAYDPCAPCDPAAAALLQAIACCHR